MKDEQRKIDLCMCAYINFNCIKQQNNVYWGWNIHVDKTAYKWGEVRWEWNFSKALVLLR